jgi:hypothetical protein
MRNCNSVGGDKPGVSPDLVLQVDQVGLDLFERGNLSLHHFDECWQLSLLDAQLLSLDFFRLPAAPALSLSRHVSGTLGAGPQTSSIQGPWLSLANRPPVLSNPSPSLTLFIPPISFSTSKPWIQSTTLSDPSSSGALATAESFKNAVLA